MLTRPRAVCWMAVMWMAAACLVGQSSEAELNRPVRRYSTQQIANLNVNKTFTFTLENGAKRVIRLVAYREYRDSVIKLLSRGEVHVEMDGRPVDLVCAPNMPTEVSELRLQPDTTYGWVEMPKQVQFSVWDASEPIVDTRRLVFQSATIGCSLMARKPTAGRYTLVSATEIQTARSSNTTTASISVAFEGREEVVSASEGTMVKSWPRQLRLP